MNIPQIAGKMVSGDVLEDKITIIEGWNLRDIAYYLESKGIAQAEEFWQIAGFPAVDYSKNADLPLPKNFSKEYQFLKDKSENIGLEGYLFPDTYQINRGATLEEIIRKMLDNFDKKLTKELREEIENQDKAISHIIAMASLIEKEVRTVQDKKIVSGILWKRMENKIPLQVDATITYITDKKTTEIYLEELEIDSPYNTYKKRGLPVGPISNPGLDSIFAAIYPEDSPYWYYLSTPEGETIFSKTLKEHEENRKKYLSD